MKGSLYTTTYTWKGNKAKATTKSGGDSYSFSITKKNGRLSKQTGSNSSYKLTYSYYQRGLRKTYSYTSNSYKYKVTYGRNGFTKKESEG